jgi:peptidoglycan/xylan/chitin deacetylase (PgdA/CDA1 family)
MNLIQRATTKLKERLSPRGLILMYHRVAETDLDPWGLSVSPNHFAEQLEVIKRYFHPMSLQDLLKRHRDGKVPNRSIAITFDDGYADNLHMAKPLLEHHDLPGTVFLVAGVLVEEQGFWWDELQWVLLRPDTLSDRLELKTNGKDYAWDLGDAVRYSLEDPREDRKRRPWEAVPGSRLAFFYSVWQHLIQLPRLERLQALEAIRAWAGVGTGRQSKDRALSLDEVNTLAQGGLVELGAHTVTHPSLSLLSITRQMEEIRDSKTQLEKIINRPVTSFSYPHGDYSAETTSLVQKAGFDCACTTEFKCVLPGSDPYQLPRFQVEDWDGEKFLRWLARWYAFS